MKNYYGGLLIIYYIFILNLSILENFIKINIKIVRILVKVFIVCFIGFRGNLGSDTIRYKEAFNLLKTSSSLESINSYYTEIGFKYFTKILSLFTNEVIYIFILGAITIYFLDKILKNEKEYYFCLLIYLSRSFVLKDLNQIRFGLSSVLLLYSLKYFDNNKFIIYNLLGVSIQKFSILFFSVKFYAKKRLKKGTYLFIFIGAIFIYLTNLLQSMLILIGKITNSELYTEGILSYEKNIFLNPLFYLKLIIILIGLSEITIMSQKERINFNIYFTSFIVLIICSNNYGLAGRVASIFSIVEPILVPNLLRNIKINKYTKLSIKLLFQFIYIVMFVSNLFREKII